MNKHAMTAWAAVVFAVAAGSAAAQGWRPPAEAQRCPSKWGAGDERGAANHMKPETVLRATKLIRTGEMIELGHVLGPNMANNPARIFSMITKRSTQAPGENQRGGNEEIITTELGQVGTQFDAFPHQIALMVNGIHQLENLKLDVLAAKGVHEFALTMQPLKIQGGTGSTVAPAAIR